MEVHVFIYEHKHGRDVSVFAGDELAVAEAARIAREWWSEARGYDPSLSERPPDDDTEVTELYFAAREGHESYEIAACPVEGISVDTVGG